MTPDAGVTPWSAMDPAEKDRFGEDIFDAPTRARWCGAVALGGLPFMWKHKARVPRKLVLDQLELRPGDRVYVIGEHLELMGIPDELRARVGAGGEVVVEDFKEKVRDMFFRNEDPKWEWDYTHDFPDEHFDCVLVMQGVAHAGDWAREGAELLRIMKPGRQAVLAEIAFGTSFYERVAADLHIEYIFEKLSEGMGRPFWDHLPGWEIGEVQAQLAPLMDDIEVFRWRGVDLLWGRKPV